jgi:poly(3-hydroxyalkanoate) synthetase
LEKKMRVGSPSRGKNYGGVAEVPVKFEALGSEARIFEKRRNLKVKIEKILRNPKGNTLSIPIRTNLAFKPHADSLDVPRKMLDVMQLTNRSFTSKLTADKSFIDYVEKQGTTIDVPGDRPRYRIG